MELQKRQTAVISNSKWANLGEQVAKLRDGESIVLEAMGDPTEEASKIRSGLNSTRACCSVRRRVKVVNERIVITRVGNWPSLTAFRAPITQVVGGE
jgi:hypothetical protein